MQLDDVLVQIGEFGKYQKRLYIIIVITWICIYPYPFLSIFVLGVPKYRCKIPEVPNDTYRVQSAFHEHLASNYIGFDESTQEYNKCSILKHNSSITDLDIGQQNASKTLKCTDWVYSKEYFDETFVTKIDLVCDNAYKVSLAKSIYLTGMLVGSLVVGVISDRFGRKKTLLVSTLLLVLCTLLLALTTAYFTFVVLQFVMAALAVGMVITTYVAGMELLGPSNRYRCGLYLSSFGTIGGLYLTLAVYLFRTWKYIQLATAIPMVLTFICLCFLKESPRWLLSRNKMSEARATLQEIAKVNGTSLPEDCLKTSEMENTDRSTLSPIRLIFTRKVLLFRSIIIFINWMAIFVSYFGLSYSADILYGDFIVNNLISYAVEFPGNILPIFLIRMFGRKKTHCLFMILGGLSSASTIISRHYAPENLQALTTVLAMFGKCCATATFATFYIFSTELFPTTVRNAGFGLCYGFARIVSIPFPFASYLTALMGNKTGEMVPIVVFGVLTVVAGLSALSLPETQNRNLSETIEDAINIQKVSIATVTEDYNRNEIKKKGVQKNSGDT